MLEFVGEVAYLAFGWGRSQVVDVAYPDDAADGHNVRLGVLARRAELCGRQVLVSGGSVDVGLAKCGLLSTTRLRVCEDAIAPRVWRPGSLLGSVQQYLQARASWRAF